MPLRHIVEQGECLAEIAGRYGISWRRIWDDENNAALRSERRNPNVLLPLDEVVIPERDIRKVRVSTGGKHVFQVRTAKTRLRLVVQDHEGHPLSGKRYKLAVGNRTLEGTVPGNGLLDVPIQESSRIGQLIVILQETDPILSITWTLAIGALDPVSSVTGLQARLTNLGFPCGAIDGKLGTKTRRAIRAFQQFCGIADTGEMDPQLWRELEKTHGG